MPYEALVHMCTLEIRLSKGSPVWKEKIYVYIFLYVGCAPVHTRAWIKSGSDVKADAIVNLVQKNDHKCYHKLLSRMRSQMLSPLLSPGALPFSESSMSPPFLRQKTSLQKFLIKNISFFWCRLPSFLTKGEKKRGLWPVPHIRVNKFYVRTAYFFGGVIFCGEELWEKGGGSVFFLFFSFNNIKWVMNLAPTPQNHKFS